MIISLSAFLPIVIVALFMYMTLWYVLARYIGRVDVVDGAWAFGFVYVALFTLIFSSNFDWVQLLSTGLITVWGMRLFLHLISRIAKNSEDKRYAAFRQKWGSQFWLISYPAIFLLQGALLLLVSTATLGIMTSGSMPNKPLAAIGFAIWVFGIIFEAIADRQLRHFVAHNKGIMDKGLWKYSRHPNYFGEMSIWWGAGLVACSLGAWWGLLSGVVITILLLKVSGVPTVEKPRANDPDYQAYKKRTSVVIPLPPKKA